MLPYFSFDKFNAGPLTIYVWGLLAGIAIVAALLVALKEAERKFINQDHIINIAIAAVVGSVVGARLFYVLEFWDYYGKNPIEIFSLGDGGLMFYGGAFGAFALTCLYVKFSKTRVNFRDTLDVVAPSLAVGEFFGRIGCALVNDHIGTITDLPWGQFYPGDGAFRHPVSVYMALNGLLIFVILWAGRKMIKTKGMLFLSFLLLYSISRFFLDFVRCGDLDICDPRYYGFTPSQYFSVSITFAVLILIIASKKNAKLEFARLNKR